MKTFTTLKDFGHFINWHNGDLHINGFKAYNENRLLVAELKLEKK